MGHNNDTTRYDEETFETTTITDEPQILVGKSKVMDRLRWALGMVARNESTVLLYGETGSGKEAAAEYIGQKYYKKGRLVIVDCASLTESLAETELFGHVKGAFTNAVAPREGLFSEAQGGIAFFDEVGEIPLHLQAKFLRLFERKEVRPIGSNRFTKVNVKIVAATNKNLADEVKSKRFREDLFARLNVITVRMPALREHREDIPELVNHFLSERPEPVAISKEALEYLMRYPWPQNVRELRGALEAATTFCDNRPNGVMTLEREDFTLEPLTFLPPIVAGLVDTPSAISVREAGKMATERSEREWLEKTYRECNGNAKEVARKTGFCYKAILNKLRKHGISLPNRTFGSKLQPKKKNIQEAIEKAASVTELADSLKITLGDLHKLCQKLGLVPQLRTLLSQENT